MTDLAGLSPASDTPGRTSRSPGGVHRIAQHARQADVLVAASVNKNRHQKTWAVVRLHFRNLGLNMAPSKGAGGVIMFDTSILQLLTDD